MGRRTGIVQRRKHSRRLLVLNQRAHNLVVEIFDRCPLDLFARVLLLFCFQRELNEDLLQLFVDVVDAELLKRVVLYKMVHVVS